MPSQNDSKTLLIPLPLGLADQYPRSVFPLMKFKGTKSSLYEVDLVLVATMDELVKMKHLAKNNAEFKQLIHDSKAQYDELLENRGNVENITAKKTFNPFKMFSNYRAVRLLSEAGIALWIETKSKSERLRRLTLSVDTQDMQPVGDDDLPAGSRITAIAISAEPETQLDCTAAASFFTETADFIASHVELLPDENPFADDYEAEDTRTTAVPEDGSASNTPTDDGVASSTSSSSRLSGASSPGSPPSRQGGNNYFIFQNSYVASRSAIQTPTLNSGGSHNQGSSSR